MANGYYQQNPQTQRMPQYGQQYQQYPPRQMYLHGSNATTTGQWVLTLFLVAIPIVNIILLFVWAFSSNTEDSKQNWARANLIWILIGIIISIIIVAVAMVLGIDVSQYYQRA